MTRSVLVMALQIAGFVALASWTWTRRFDNFRSSAALVLAGVGALAFYDGFSLAVLEESRSRYGQVMSGVVEECLSSTGERGSRTIGGGGSSRGSPIVRTSGFDLYEELSRFLVTGSFDAWVVDYRYACPAGSGPCRGRDFVSRALWMRLDAGHTVNVRRSTDETRTARLDENPQRALAFAKTAIACVLLAVAGMMSGRLKLFRRCKYIQADAVVTSVTKVLYGDEARWKVAFAYFDVEGNAQDSVDEVNDPTWKAGDDCYAVYSPKTPAVATLHGRAEPPRHAVEHAVDGGRA